MVKTLDVAIGPLATWRGMVMRRLSQIVHKPRMVQVSTLYAGTVAQFGLGLVTSVMLTRTLGPEQWGHYSYLFNLASFLLIVVTPGHFVSTGMILAHTEESRSKRDLIGTGFLVALFISLVFGAIVFGFSFAQDRLFHDKIGGSIRLLSFAFVLFPLQAYLENVFMGLNHIGSLSILRALPRLLYVIALLVYSHFSTLGFLSAFLLLLFTSYAVYITEVAGLRPTFSEIRANFRRIMEDNRRYGSHVYVGSLVGVATTYACTLAVSYFADNTRLGFYSLALTLSSPLVLLPNVVATTFFRSFAGAERLPGQLIKYTIILSLASYFAFVLLLKEAVLLLYSAEYLESVFLAYLLGIGMIVHGFGDIFNRFLCAKAKGKEVRNGAFLAGFVNVLAFFTLVPFLSSTGAALTRCLVGIAYLSAMLFYYRGNVAAGQKHFPKAGLAA